MSERVSDKGPGTQLIVFLVSRLGMKDAIKVATFIVQWGVVERALKHRPSKEEFVVYWKESQATYYRDLGRFRKVWPDDVDPHARWQWVEANVKLPRGELEDGAVLALLLAPVRP